MALGFIAKLVVRILLDVLYLCVAYACAVWLATGPDEQWAAQASRYAVYFLVFAFVWCAVTFDQHLYVSRRGESLTAILFSVTKVYFITVLFSGFGLALFLRWNYSRPFFVAFAATTLGVMLAAVLITRPGLLALRRRYRECRVLFVGVDERAAELAQAFLADEHRLYHVVGFLEEDPARGAALEEAGVPYLGKVHEIEHLLVDRMIDEVYLALPLGEYYEEVERAAHLCETIGVPVRLVGDIFPVQLAECDVARIGDVPLLSLMTKPSYLTNIQLTRATEAITALLLLCALAPLLALIAVIIKLETQGPVFVTKGQPGGGPGSNLLAFRVHRRPHPGEPPISPVPLTRFGVFLRRYGLEELPRLVNVLLGQATYMGVPVAGAKRANEARRDRSGAWAHLRPRVTPTLLLAAMDAGCITIAYVIAIRFTALTPDLMKLSLVNYLPFWGVLILAWYAAAIERRLWRWRSVEPLTPEAFGLLKAVGNAAVVSGFVLAVFIPGVRSTRTFLLYFFALSFVALFMLRVAARYLTRIVYFLGYRIRRVVIVGANERTVQLVHELGGETRFGYRVVGIIDDEEPRAGSMQLSGVPYLGTFSDLKPLLEEHRVDEAYVTLPVRSHFATIKQVVSQFASVGMPVHVVGSVLPLSVAKSRVVLIGDVPLITISTLSETYAWQAIKRLQDFVAATLLLIAFSPLFIVLAILIKRDSKGPVFFVQDRIGQNHRPFKMVKFRSMISNAEELKKDLMHLNEADGPVFKIKSDPRVTPLGHFLRKYSLDELPQLFNVWLGHMSLVGPRPLMPHEVDKFKWFERRRVSVKPGMTGSWQVSGRSDIAFDEWVQMDLAYIDSWSFSQDFRILLKTFKAVFSGRGAA